jgi:type VI secretion system protein ImpM
MEVGLYGKLHTHGDFLRRRVADDFVARWDSWLQQCMTESRSLLGDAWLDTYLTSPVWRFALTAEVCGAAAVAGLLVPSVDRVGRYFPLTLVWETPANLSSLEIAVQFRSGFEQAERLLLDTLAAERVEFAEFDRRVMELATHFEPSRAQFGPRLSAATASAWNAPPVRPRCIPLQSAASLALSAVQLYGQLLDAGGGGAIWWTDGSAAVEPSWLIARGLPDGSQYSAMLDGGWHAAGWELGGPAGTVSAAEASAHEPPPSSGFLLASGAHSDRGTVRTVNQDAFIDRPDLRLWAVADGMGGLSDGDIASRMVCDSLANTPIAANLDAQCEAIVEQLRQVNDYLRRCANREINPIHSGSTVVVLVIRDDACAVLWAGDSRAYRLRNGVLSQLTKDHSWSVGGSDVEAITRAVGGEDELLPEMVRSDLREGDRLLLCSDGVYRALADDAIAAMLGTGVPAACCKELVTRAMLGGSTDNVTALVVACGVNQPSDLTDALDIVSSRP